jgi:hypothetical protein
MSYDSAKGPVINLRVPQETTNFVNCWVLHPVARVSTNAFLKTTVSNNVFVLDFIVHYLLHNGSVDIHSGHLNIYIFCTFYLKMATDQGRNM